jgi:hypothetical protein
MKARAATPLFEQALTANSLAKQVLTPTRLPEGEVETAPPPFSPGEGGRRAG